jgi:crotonobetainyl-CoA:carnitine CoA-transferase CaiB-like acyl-CoA transferase
VKRSPLLGEYTEEILVEPGYSAQEIAEIKARAITAPEKGARRKRRS